MKEKEYIGNISQLFDIKDYKLVGGVQDGVRATTINNGNGLIFTVVADRCMDIAELSFKGVNLSFINACGIVAPQYYDNKDIQWLRSFTAGFLTTCGLKNVGSPCVDNGQSLGLHGRISNIPAENYYVERNIVDNNIVARLSGTMRESVIFGESLELSRNIEVSKNDNTIVITDKVTNNGFSDCEEMLLYHFNIGYPFLCEKSELVLEKCKVIPRDDEAKKGIDTFSEISAPEINYNEQVFFINFENKNPLVKMVNKEKNLEMSIKIDHNMLDTFVLWKNFQKGAYVMGLEPSNCKVYGRAKEREAGTLKSIKAGETKTYITEISFKQL
jgi:hypothetical protein